MVEPIKPVDPQSIINIEGIKDLKPKEGERSFKDILQDTINKVSQTQQEADLSIEKLLKGEASPDEVMIAFRKAQIAFETLMQVRNKIIDAFEEIQRMRI
jgi:flagellar hook-basal body complex protein FliE